MMATSPPTKDTHASICPLTLKEMRGDIDANSEKNANSFMKFFM